MNRFRARKSLGQSFLVHAPTAGRLVGALDLEPGDRVLEIGPGKGALTRVLVRHGARVTAVELDRRLVQLLREQFPPERLDVVEGDFLEYEMASGKPVKVIGNLPYNVSSQVLFRLLEFRERWSSAVLTTQREFADRVLAVPGTKAFGAISVFTEVACQRTRLFNIPAVRFKPKPAVVSTSFRLDRRPEPLVRPSDPDLFRRMVKTAFAQRRKTLVNNLRSGFGLDKDAACGLLESCGVPVQARAEKVDVVTFGALADRLAELLSG
jgi:16S rRNA (adenine1518-N6/adenine1519-N6)-dimethyltransferase